MSLPARVRLVSLLLLVILLVTSAPAQAAIGPIDPTRPAPAFLPKAEIDKLAALQSPIYPVPVSDISPDDTAVLTGFIRGSNQVAEISILDITTGARQLVDRRAFVGSLTGDYRWLDNATLVHIGLDRTAGPVLVTIDRATGAVTKKPVRLPGVPLTLSPGGRRLLLGVEVRDRQPAREGIPTLSFDEEVKLTLAQPPLLPDEFGRPLTASAGDGTLRALQTRVGLLVLDLATGQVTPLFELPEGTIPIAWAWSADSARFALVRTQAIEARAYRLTELVTQDVLGNVPPEQNPFLQRNVVDLVDFTTGSVRPAALRATEGNGDTFFNVEWAPDGKTLLTQMAVPSRLAGRTHPIYTFALAERAYLRFYSADGQFLNTFDSPDIEAFFPVPYFVAPDEVIVRAVNGTNLGLYYYNRATGEFRRLPLPPGSVISDARATRTSRQVVFNFSSFVQVPELFRLNWDGTALTALTFNNTELAKINQVRADEVTFTLANGQQRTGYLIQPAGAAFPPQNVPLIVWQEGGPTSSMINFYGSQTERPFNLLPNFGQALLFMPLTGRIGFGVERYRALYNNRNFGQQDIDEMAEIVQQMIGQGMTSRGKVGVTGCSYGGYFAAQSITRHPDLYAAANPQCTLLDLFLEWQFGTRSLLMAYIMGAPATSDGQAYAEDSPLYNASRVRAATLIFHGTNDFLPVPLVATFHDQILANGAAVNMYGFVGEGHGLQSFNSQQAAAQLQIQWFRQYLAP